MTMKANLFRDLIDRATRLGIETTEYSADDGSWQRLEQRVEEKERERQTASAARAGFRVGPDTPEVPAPTGRPAPLAISKEDLFDRFSYHPADTDIKQAHHENIRAACLDLAEFLVGTMPAGREASTAITKLEEVMMWANAAVARNDPDKLYGDSTTPHMTDRDPGYYD